jgi:hypothetical protein
MLNGTETVPTSAIETALFLADARRIPEDLGIRRHHRRERGGEARRAEAGPRTRMPRSQLAFTPQPDRKSAGL